MNSYSPRDLSTFQRFDCPEADAVHWAWVRSYRMPAVDWLCHRFGLNVVHDARFEHAVADLVADVVRDN